MKLHFSSFKAIPDWTFNVYYIYDPLITHTLRTKQRTGDHATRNSWFKYFTCSSSLTLSMGATAVLEMAAAMPPAKKSFMKLTTASDMVGCVLCRAQSLAFSKLNQGPQGNPTPVQVDETPPMPSYIWGAFIARVLSDGFAFCRTVKRGWINFRGWSSNAPYSWCQDRPSWGRLKDTLCPI